MNLPPIYQYTTRRGYRAALPSPIGRRRTAAISCRQSLATRVLIENRRAIGVELVDGEGTRRVLARREVILSAGPIQSPKLLALSGVGRPGVLRQHGIRLVHALPGVGENLQDHPNTRVAFECSRPITIK
jgi:choline dehydrogenase